MEVVRRKAFASRDSFESLEEANQYLCEVCEKLNQKPRKDKENLTAVELLKQEKEHLLPSLPMFDAADIRTARVDKYSAIVIDQNHYSVPDHLVGEVIQVKVYSNRIQCFYQENKVAEHLRLTGLHEWRLSLEHYLTTLKKKPGALASSVALQQADKKIQAIYKSYYINKEKEFIDLIHYMGSEANLEEIERSIEELCKIHPSHVTTEKIKLLSDKNRETLNTPVEFSEGTQHITNHSVEHLKMYDELFQTQTVGSGGEIA